MIKLGINGLGRIGRLALRVAADNPAFQVCRVNDPAGDEKPWPICSTLILFKRVGNMKLYHRPTPSPFLTIRSYAHNTRASQLQPATDYQWFTVYLTDMTIITRAAIIHTRPTRGLNMHNAKNA